jgi:DNA-binding IclR family transcriptional regulator
MADAEMDEDGRQGVQSVEVGVTLLRALAAHGAPMMLRDLARQAGMPAAKAHRYLVSFVRTGLVAQDPASGRYDLGAFALELGLASLARLDAVKLAEGELDALAEQIGETVALAVWGNMGPTIVRWVDSRRPINVNLRTGSVMPLLNSAIGLCFAAFCDLPAVRVRVTEELAHLDAGDRRRTAFETGLNEARRHGMTRAVGSVLPGINAFCAPAFDREGRMVAGLAALGPEALFSADWDSDIATAVSAAGRRVSQRLGWECGKELRSQES